MYLSKERLRLVDVTAQEIADFELPGGAQLAFMPHVAWESWPDDIGLAGSHQNVGHRRVPAEAVHQIDFRGIYQRQFADNEGVQRLLELYSTVGVTTSWVLSGQKVVDFPELAREVRDGGHEMSSQNWLHDMPIMMTPEEERESTRKTVDAFQEVLGTKPFGWVSPSGRPSPHTTKILLENGYIWQGDLINTETPYVLTDDTDEHRRIVALPFMASDYGTYRYESRSPRQHYEMLWDSVQYMTDMTARTGKPCVLGFAVHPFLAQGSRLQPYRELLERVSAMNNVWTTTRAECARHCLELFESSKSMPISAVSTGA